MSIHRGELLHVTGGERDIHAGDRVVGSITSTTDAEIIVDIGYVVHAINDGCHPDAKPGRVAIVELQRRHEKPNDFVGQVVRIVAPNSSIPTWNDINPVDG